MRSNLASLMQFLFHSTEHRTIHPKTPHQYHYAQRERQRKDRYESNSGKITESEPMEPASQPTAKRFSPTTSLQNRVDSLRPHSSHTGNLTRSETYTIRFPPGYGGMDGNEYC